MIIYKCLTSGDEMFSDIYTIKTSEDGLFYEVDGQYVTRKVGDFDDALIGANASAEEVCEGTETSYVTGVDIVLNHDLKETSFSKKAYMVFIKGYAKALKLKIEDDKQADFEEDIKKAAKKMGSMVGTEGIQFFTGESVNHEGIVGILNHRPDGDTPYMLFFKWGLAVEKC